jgi:hypothetical protein
LSPSYTWFCTLVSHVFKLGCSVHFSTLCMPYKLNAAFWWCKGSKCELNGYAWRQNVPSKNQ